MRPHELHHAVRNGTRRNLACDMPAHAVDDSEKPQTLVRDVRVFVMSSDEADVGCRCVGEVYHANRTCGFLGVTGVELPSSLPVRGPLTSVICWVDTLTRATFTPGPVPVVVRVNVRIVGVGVFEFNSTEIVEVVAGPE